MLDDLPPYETFQSRLWAMSVLFTVSLFASSFPALSKRIRYLRIPRIVFFLGRHFGTGVILATAFVHLLQDAFDNLSHPEVKQRWKIGKWTGFIVFGSLLSIFLIEYISTSYVDRLQSYSSPSPSPPPSRPISRPPGASQTIPPPPQSTLPLETEQTPLIASQSHSHSHSRQHSTATVIGDPPTNGEHNITRYESQTSHPRRSFIRYSNVIEDDDLPKYGSVRRHSILSSANGHSRLTSTHSGHGHVHLGMEDWDPDADETSSMDDELGKVKVGRKRQVVGILMLQMGIMIHSLVIGLTLSITSGAEFTSLITAIIFHQLFEGFSLGIRIAGLPASGPSDGKGMSVLKPTLMFSFAVTPPVGIALGLFLFGNGRSAGAQLKLTEGVLSAVSSGMLIYAACVEMLAGDFIMDPSLWKRSIRDQVLALFSLLAGAAAMSAIGLWD
ncbi:Zinc/iron permease [Cristinia sonorae]|uniref:Zinc/iron permease n=1 Tax=Cristinia sonorae TaxID=1940300 RepID=A0A8K0UWI6_9AGAR|nr:Zinc/iron permease [Cristinia sonorae]